MLAKRTIRRLILRAVLGWISAFLLISCVSFPKPTEERNSLLIISFFGEDRRNNPQLRDLWAENFEFSGPEELRFTVSFQNGYQTFVFSLKPGTYRAIKREVSYDNGRTFETRLGGINRESFNVPENSIVLLPQVFKSGVYMRNSYNPATWPLADEDRKRLSEELSDTLGFSEWIGRLFIGFGQFTPRMTMRKDEYRLRLLSEPAGAEVIVDNEKRGETPTAVDLAAGKHMIEVRKEGFSTWRNYVDVDSDNEISMSLKTTETVGAQKEEGRELKRNQYGLLVMPFRNLGGADSGQLQSVFHESLGATFSQDKRILVFRTPEDAPKTDARAEKMKPDFAAANKAGADLMVAGDYLAEGENLLIHAALYDVQKESAKADILYASKTGISIFDSIDDMTKEFGAAVDKVLPESGKQIVERKEVVSTEITSLEKKVSQKDVIDKRSQRKHDLALTVGLGALLDTYDYSGSAGSGTLNRYRGPDFGAGVTYTYHFTNLFGLTGEFNYLFGVAPKETSAPSEIRFCLGPEFTFSGMLMDLYLRLLGQFGTTKSQEQFLPSGGASIGKSGTFYYYGLLLDSGIKLYLYRRYSSLGWYFNFGLKYSPLLFREGTEDLNKERVLVPFDALFYLGMGVRI